MVLRLARWITAVALVLGGACGCSSEPSEESSGKLSDGVHGPQKVAAGDRLEAEHDGAATVESDSTGAGITVQTEAGKTTTVRGVHVRCRGSVGLLVRGTGAFVGENLNIECTRGIGIVAEGPSSFRLANSTVRGNITQEAVSSIAFPLSGEQASILGIALSNVQGATFEEVSVQGFGGFGTVAINSDLNWKGGTVTGNVGVGMLQQGGAVSLTDVQIQQTWAGEIGLAIYSYALVVSDKGRLASKSLTIDSNEGYGILQSGGWGTHEGLVITNNRDVGYWVQKSAGTAAEPVLRIGGTGNDLSGNKGGALFLLASSGIEVSGLRAANAAKKPVMTSDLVHIVDMADGIQVSGVTSDLSLKDLTFENNLRANLLLDGPPPTGLTLSGIVFGSSTEPSSRGVVTQNGTWDLGPSAITYNDAALKQRDQEPLEPQGVASSKSSIVAAAGMNQGLIGAGRLVSEEGVLDSTVVVNDKGLSK